MSRTSQKAKTVPRAVLEARLRELEEALGAIRAGEVDALVVHTDEGDQVYTLTTADKAYRVLVEAMGEGALTLAADGTVLYANPQMGRILGATTTAVTGTRFDHWATPEAAAFVTKALHDQRPVRVECDLVRVDATRIPVLLSASPIRQALPVRLGLVVTDQTATREARGLLEQRVAERTRELRGANEEMEAFTYSVSHDLRSPLRTIDAFTESVLERASRGEAAEDDVARVRAATQRMRDLIDDILTLSRIGRASLHCVDVDITTRALEMLGALQAREPARDATFRVRPGLHANADAVLLDTALANLIENAWKYTSRRKGATIEVGRERTLRGDAFFVRDNGAGFDPTFAGKLFQPFQRLHSAAEFPGTGVGLASVKRVIARHGGEVWAEGAVDQGATFYFTIPRERSPIEKVRSGGAAG